MTNLIEKFKYALNQAVDKYESSRGKIFKRNLRVIRAEDLRELRQLINAATSGASLKAEILNKIEDMEVQSNVISWFADWLDLNALKNRLAEVLNEEAYSITNLLIAENSQIRQHELLLYEKIDQLTKEVEKLKKHSPQSIEELEFKVNELTRSLNEKVGECVRLQDEIQENEAITKDVCEQRDHYKAELNHALTIIENLKKEQFRLLEENKKLRDNVKVDNQVIVDEKNLKKDQSARYSGRFF